MKLPLSLANLLLILLISSGCTQEKPSPSPPTTLEEAHSELERLLPAEVLAEIDAMETEEEMIRFHFGFGTGIRNSWGLWHNSALSQHMQKLGFTHPDDMSGVILETFWCKRHKKPFRLNERAAYYKAYWQENKDPPDSAVTPDDGSDIEWVWSQHAEGRLHRRIHIGKSQTTGAWWAFEHTTGVYAPSDEMIEKGLNSGVVDEQHHTLPLNSGSEED